MRYIDKSLVDGEYVIEQAQVHWIVLVLPACLSAFLILQSVPTAINLSFLLGACELLVGFGVLALVERLRIESVEIAVTNVRAVRKAGWLSTSTRELFLLKVEGISVSQGLLGGFSGMET